MASKEKALSYVYTYKVGGKMVYVGVGTGPGFNRALDIKDHEVVYATHGREVEVSIVAWGLERETALKIEGAIGTVLSDSLLNVPRTLVKPLVISTEKKQKTQKRFLTLFRKLHLETADDLEKLRRIKDPEGIRNLNLQYAKMLYSAWLQIQGLDYSDPNVRKENMEKFRQNPAFTIKQQAGVFGKVLSVNAEVWKSLAGKATTLKIPKEAKIRLHKLKKRLGEVSPKTVRKRLAGLEELVKEYPELRQNVDRWKAKHNLQ